MGAVQNIFQCDFLLGNRLAQASLPKHAERISDGA